MKDYSENKRIQIQTTDKKRAKLVIYEWRKHGLKKVMRQSLIASNTTNILTHKKQFAWSHKYLEYQQSCREDIHWEQKWK